MYMKHLIILLLIYKYVFCSLFGWSGLIHCCLVHCKKNAAYNYSSIMTYKFVVLALVLLMHAILCICLHSAGKYSQSELQVTFDKTLNFDVFYEQILNSIESKKYMFHLDQLQQ